MSADLDLLQLTITWVHRSNMHATRHVAGPPWSMHMRVSIISSDEGVPVDRTAGKCARHVNFAADHLPG